MIAWARPVHAQNADTPIRNTIPFARIGFFGGRSGTSLGPTGYVEINPIRWVGVCAFVSYSNISSNYAGGRAHQWDASTGLCMTAHAPEVKGFLISPFVQMSYQNDHERVAIPVGNGAFYKDGEDHIRRMWTAGAGIDRAIVRGGPRWAVRIGKNFGKSPAAQDGKGLYFVAGIMLPLDHPIRLMNSLRFGHKAESARD
jgi:hypothetical protein